MPAGWPSTTSSTVTRAATYQCAFCGFAPGFAYLTGLDPALHLPAPRDAAHPGARPARWPSPPTYTARLPDGLTRRLAPLGRTDAALWDPTRDPPALIAPGTTVRFGRRHRDRRWRSSSSGGRRRIQDAGRPGLAAIGVPPSGALDPAGAALVNRLVGNPEDAAVLETAGGLRVRSTRPVRRGHCRRTGRAAPLEPGDDARRRAGRRAALGVRSPCAAGSTSRRVLGSREPGHALGPRPASARGRAAAADRRRSRHADRRRPGARRRRRRRVVGVWPGPAARLVRRRRDASASWRRAGPCQPTSAASVSASTARHCGAPDRRRAAERGAASPAPCRCRRTGDRSSCWPTTRPPAATR